MKIRTQYKIFSMAKVRRVFLFILVLTLLFPLGGCLFLRVIRDRLPPPHPVKDGILFQYEAPSAKYVNLAGDFNNWCGTKGTGRFDATIDPMEDNDGDGIWEIIIPLKPGRYQYKFVIDRGVRWVLDPNNPDTDWEGGFKNSLLIVK